MKTASMDDLAIQLLWGRLRTQPAVTVAQKSSYKIASSLHMARSYRDCCYVWLQPDLTVSTWTKYWCWTFFKPLRWDLDLGGLANCIQYSALLNQMSAKIDLTDFDSGSETTLDNCTREAKSIPIPWKNVRMPELQLKPTFTLRSVNEIYQLSSINFKMLPTTPWSQAPHIPQ